MSDLSYMDKLLNGVEVKWKMLGELADNLDSMRKPIAGGLRESGSIPYYGASGIVDYVKGYIFDGDYLLVSEDGANLIARSTPIAFSISGKNWVNNHAHVLRFETYSERRYIEYYLNSIDLTPYISGASQPKLNQKNLNSIRVPVPPFNVQVEIVQILDTFTELTGELTGELVARKQQYTYYRDHLLTFEESKVEWKALEDVFNILVGGDVPKDALSDTETEEFNIPILSNGIGDRSLYGWTDKARVVQPSITISARGTIGWTSYRDKPVFPIVRLLVLTPKIELDLKYAYYYMKAIENNYNVPKNGIPQLTKPMIKDIEIPIPALVEQQRIVTILDKFDALTTSLTEGLPREIELRQKQYEYYRELLLNFPKPEVADHD